MDVQPTVTEMKKQLATTYRNELGQLVSVFRTVEAKGQIADGTEFANAVKVADKSGYIRYSTRAKRYMFTEKGTKFFRQMKKHGHA